MISLHLNKELPVYKPEEIVTGYVEVKVPEPFTVQVCLNGSAEVHWYERKTDYLNEVKYFDNLNVPLNVEAKTVSGEGVQKFPFAVQLPENLPTSFENINAKIIYSLSAILSNVPRSRKQEFKQIFYVVRDWDLNKFPELHTGLKENGEGARGMMCCKSEPIKMELSTKRGGFVSGQTIDFNVKVENLTQNELNGKCFQVELVQNTRIEGKTLFSKTTGSFEKVIESVKCGESFLPNATKEWDGSLKIPVVAPSCWRKCSIITCNYFLCLTFNPSGFFSHTTRVILPLFIGTIPIQSDLKAQEAPSCSFEKSKFTDNSAFKGIIKLNEIDLFTKKNKQANLGPFYPFYTNI